MSGSVNTKDTHKGGSSQTASPEMQNLILEKLTVLRAQNDHLIQQNMIMIHQNQVMINNNMTVIETLKGMTSSTMSVPKKPDTPVSDTDGEGKGLPSKADNNH
ncbi:hypothetical protein CcaCcLH18_07637 [Colletotrichum camelliae]|nr:hypothetical protein CcaCcLH18_07637 [Colletotrichum camelliae]